MSHTRKLKFRRLAWIHGAGLTCPDQWFPSVKAKIFWLLTPRLTWIEDCQMSVFCLTLKLTTLTLWSLITLASNHKPTNKFCAEANSASYPQRDVKMNGIRVGNKVTTTAADWSDIMSANCTKWSNCPLVQAMDWTGTRCGTISTCLSAATSQNANCR